jgi:hypothetical protein
MEIPREPKNWRGIFPGNYTGDIWASWNIDLEKNPGRITLSNHMDSVSSASQGLGVVSKFIRTNATATDQWFGIVDGTDIIRNGNSSIVGGTWATDDTTGTFNDPRDMVLHEFANGEQRLLCTRATDMAILNKSGGANVWDDDWWTTVAGGPTLTSLTYHPLARLQRLVVIGDKQSNIPVIHTLDKDDVDTNSRLSFGAEFTIRNINTSRDRYWIGAQHDFDGPAKIFEWDGFSLTYNYEYELTGGSFPLCQFVVRDVPYVITERGYIMRHNGWGFEVVQSFNLDEEQMVFDTGTTSNATIKTYGAWVDGDLVYLNVGIPLRVESGANAFRGVRRARSGIWIYNTKTNNLYHHRGLGERLAAGNRNFGNPVLSSPGAVVKAVVSTDRILVASAGIYTGGATWVSNSTQALFRDNIPTTSDLNRGYFITPFIPVEEVEAAWEALWVKFKRFVDSGNRIVVKWRVRDPLRQQESVGTNNETFSPLQAAGTWATTTTFTCAVPTGVGVGDEVEVLNGDNAGGSYAISALSAIPDGSTSITVTIAEAAPVSSTDTALFRFDNFRSETAISSTTVGNQRVPFSVPTTGGAGNLHGEFIQIKVELRGVDNQIDELIPVAKPLTKRSQG